MASQFNIIGIFGRVKNPGVIETLKSLIHYLHSIKQEFVVDAETAESLDDPSLPTVPREELSQTL